MRQEAMVPVTFRAKGRSLLGRSSGWEFLSSQSSNGNRRSGGEKIVRLQQLDEAQEVVVLVDIEKSLKNRIFVGFTSR
jgi:hypothetical protein